jgi:predicted DCC family thiol-disulfide oxidoreductase YuxK
MFMTFSAASSTDEAARESAATIIYDGECIFCQNYVKLVRLRETVGPVRLIDARSGDPMVLAYQEKGYDLNQGMLFIYNDQVHYGSEAVFILGGLSSPLSLFNRLNRIVFSSRMAAKLLYPLLKIGRRVTLFLRGKSLIPAPK